MTTSLPEFGFSTTAENAASALSSYINGKTVLVTGHSKGGLGFETARAIALQKPELLILAGRSTTKNEESKKLIEKDLVNKGVTGVEIKLLELDLGSFTAVRKSAERLNRWDWGSKGIDVVINNAAIM
jgi:NAD(P)-dependent dehydrogenase (short-subunit alcohol dehydrogenase family)